MSGSGEELHMEEEEEEELLPKLSEPWRQRSPIGAATLGLGLIACVLCALVWPSSLSSRVAVATAEWKHSLTVLYGDGRVRAKDYDWKDSNMALYGSDKDKKVAKDSAATEPAWDGAGKKSGIEVWRANKFRIERIPEEDKGKFYSGDSYIVLNTFQENGSDKLLYHLHIWIGKYTTRDELGTVDYKTVELNTRLGGKAKRHREVQGHESSGFKRYFESMNILKGGVDSGFKRQAKAQTHYHLFKIDGNKITEVPAKLRSLDDEHLFVFDGDDALYLITSGKPTRREVIKARTLLRELQAGRPSPVKIKVEKRAALSGKVKSKLE